MNSIPPSAISSIAATSHAAAKGGAADDQQTRSTAQSTTADSATPSGQVDAGDSSQDRGGDGRQVYDVFEKEGEEQSEDSAENNPRLSNEDGSNGGLDLEM